MSIGCEVVISTKKGVLPHKAYKAAASVKMKYHCGHVLFAYSISHLLNVFINLVLCQQHRSVQFIFDCGPIFRRIYLLAAGKKISLCEICNLPLCSGTELHQTFIYITCRYKLRSKAECMSSLAVYVLWAYPSKVSNSTLVLN